MGIYFFKLQKKRLSTDLFIVLTFFIILLLGGCRILENCKKTIHGVVSKLDDSELSRLSFILQSNDIVGDLEVQDQSSEAAQNAILKWIDRWKEETDRIHAELTQETNAKAEEVWLLHRNFNDELLKNGFFELALAIIELEDHIQSWEVSYNTFSMT